ncbi:hypothetical protein Q3P06_25205 [Ralstonia pseudosolanacearum]|uniref:hypothetical protein n=1 Tax=Ralstonia pseudosolanacearum TaxID=1310165 RepID=UPI002675A7B8|nr:hypothetical protein [Ralstonia pseudosolanacearum]MDO3515187.1 hypothetical protein [Ralstonia pseudosolanacearum]MDO3634005.1 hypothetical protein [Ralstonia pseudosolanacearum]
MQVVNLGQAKSSQSRLAKAIERRQEREIIIASNTHPAAKLVPIDTVPVGARIVAAALFSK